MSQFYDALETRNAQERESQQYGQLKETLAAVMERSPYYKELLADADLAQMDAAGLARLPLTRKSELQSLQQEQPPFGRLVSLKTPTLKRLFASPGPIYEPQTRGEDGWRFARALYAAGVREGNLLYNCFFKFL